MARAWRCSAGAKKSMMRLTLSAASIVWTVDITR